MSDIDTVLVDSLKALDPNGRLEKRTSREVAFVPKPAVSNCNKSSTTASATKRLWARPSEELKRPTRKRRWFVYI